MPGDRNKHRRCYELWQLQIKDCLPCVLCFLPA